MSVDELVNIGKVYARDEGYGIDSMGVLALSDRINLIHEPSSSIGIRDVQEIIDEAIEKANSHGKGLFGRLSGNKEDEGKYILKEKDIAFGQ